jgi:F0F1-type ATP synthase gamma subunit
VNTEQHLVDWITRNAQNHTAVNRTELLHYCGETFGTAVTPGRVDSFFFRHKLELSETISRPQENPQLEIPQSFLDKIMACFSEHLLDSCAELVFNLDEVGISEWEDRASRKVIVPVSMTDQMIHHGLHRNLKHMSMTY